jgi:hypothetical protein
MKYMVVGMLVDDGPFLDGPKRNTLIDAIRVETAAADEVSEFLVVGGGWKFRLLDRQRQAARVGDLLVADGSEGGATQYARMAAMGYFRRFLARPRHVRLEGDFGNSSWLSMASPAA